MTFVTGNETYYTWAEALDFITECEAVKAQILGMDFMLVDDVHRPVGSTDWQGLPAERSWAAARSLLRDGIPEGGNFVIFVVARS